MRASFRRVPLGLGALLGVIVAAGCSFPEYTYVDSSSGGSSGSGGTAGGGGSAGTGATGGSAGTGATGGSAGTGATGGSAGIGGTTGDDAGDAQPDVEEDVSEDVVVDSEPDTSDDANDDAPEVADDAADDAVDGPQEADAPVDAPMDVDSDCQGTTENCTNGVDDDCDGKIDCEDLNDCSAVVRCAPPVPTGWTGTFAVYSGAPVGFNSCPSQFPSLGIFLGDTPSFQPATCSGCTCGGATGVSCSQPGIRIYQDKLCSSAYGWDLNNMNANTCYNVGLDTTQGDPADYPESVYVTPGSATTGSCTPSGGQPTTGNVTWSSVKAACEVGPTTAGGCTGQFKCMPKPPAGFTGGVCIYQAGIVANCPSTFSANRFVAYEGWTDSRACDTCQCGFPSVICHATVTVSTGTACTPNPGSVAQTSVTDQGCGAFATPLTNSTPWNYLVRWTEQTPDTNGCTPAGGAPVGTVTPNANTAYTICCAF